MPQVKLWHTGGQGTSPECAWAVKVERSPLALERVDDIAQYLARGNPDAAVRWVVELFDTVDRVIIPRCHPSS